MPIEACDRARFSEAARLVRNVFPWMSPSEYVSLYVIANPRTRTSALLMRLAGVRDIVAFDVYLGDDGHIGGTTGLYRYEKDAHEALWVVWFCVDPRLRGKGVGQALIEHTIDRAREAGFPLLRLYTSTDPNEAAAQRLYERNGFREIGRKRGLFSTTLYREKRL